MSPGNTIRIKPGLKNQPTISGREVVVVEVGHEKLKVKLGTLEHWVQRSEVQKP
jgi:hypothetical protein